VRHPAVGEEGGQLGPVLMRGLPVGVPSTEAVYQCIRWLVMTIDRKKAR
jgi:hypothetical protein